MDAYPPNPRTNIQSIICLVTSVLGLAIVPVILGHVAISQIKKTGEQGIVMAVIGLVIGYATVFSYLAIVGVAVAFHLTAGM